MIGVIGISGKMGNFMANLLNGDIIGYDVISSDKYKTYSNIDDFLNNELELVVDFSNSELSKIILPKVIDKKIKVITGTSNIPNIKEIAKKAYDNKISFVFLENFSKGINEIIQIIDKISFDEIELIEEHYFLKKDISATALVLAEILNIKQISSVRTIKKQSNHYIKFYNDGEVIILTHKCNDYNAYREIFLKEVNLILQKTFYYKYSLKGEYYDKAHDKERVYRYK